MLNSILSISGKPGLFKLISQSKNMLIIESVTDGKRMPSFATDKVISLSDIAMYTDTEEVPLWKVLSNLKELEKGAIASISPKSEPDALREYFGKVLPNFDRDRVYPTDIKKLLVWYNTLVETGNDDFSDPKAAKEEEKA